MADRPVLAITGGTGFVGSTLLEETQGMHLAVRALTRRAQPARPDVTWIEGSLEDEGALARLCEGADAVLHIAGVVNAPDRAGFFAGNVEGTRRVVAAAKGAGVSRFVHVSSLSAREPKLSDYGRSKAESEAVVKVAGMDGAIVRPPGIYGPGDTEMLELFRMAARGFVLMPPRGRMSVIHAADLARLLLALAEEGAPSGVTIEPDDGVPNGWSHLDFADALGEAVGRKVWALSMPAPLVHLAARGDRLVRRGKAKLTPDRARYMVHDDWTVDPARRPAPQLWEPAIETRAGLAATASWYREQGWLR